MTKISVSIDVPDLEQAVQFYSEALGCVKLRDQPPKMVVLSADNLEIYLLEKAASTRPIENGDQSRSYERHWTPVHLDFAVTDVDAAVSAILGSGGSHDGGAKGDWGAIAHCADPFGNGFCVIRE